MTGNKTKIAPLSVEKRKGIAQEHAKRNGGVYRPALFVEEASAKSHPAHRWFEWDDAKASHEFRLHQARHFVSGIRIVSEIVLNEHDPITIKSSPVHEPVGKPFMVSNRRGDFVQHEATRYVEHVTNEAYTELSRWLSRYGAHLRENGEEASVKLVVRAAEALAKTAAA